MTLNGGEAGDTLGEGGLQVVIMLVCWSWRIHSSSSITLLTLALLSDKQTCSCKFYHQLSTKISTVSVSGEAEDKFLYKTGQHEVFLHLTLASRCSGIF